MPGTCQISTENTGQTAFGYELLLPLATYLKQTLLAFRTASTLWRLLLKINVTCYFIVSNNNNFVVCAQFEYNFHFKTEMITL